MTYEIRQIVSIGNRCDKGDLPTTDPTRNGDAWEYASSAQGGLCVFGTAAGETPPKDGGAAYVARVPGRTIGLRVSGNFGDAAAVQVWVGREGKLRHLDTLTVTSTQAFGYWPIPMAADEVVGLTDTGGGVTAARDFEVVRGELAGGASQ